MDKKQTIKKKIGKKIIGIAICIIIGAVIGIIISKIPYKRIDNLNDISVEQIKEGKQLLVDYETIEGCPSVWEVSQVDPGTNVRYYYSVYLVPIQSSENVYVGVMIEESKSDRERNRHFNKFAGKVCRYDSFMLKEINEQLDDYGMNNGDVTILPYYINTGINKWKLVFVTVPIMIIITVVTFIIIMLRNKKGRKAESEVVLFLRDSYSAHNGDLYGKLKWNKS